jgi:hypothetical protein
MRSWIQHTLSTLNGLVLAIGGRLHGSHVFCCQFRDENEYGLRGNGQMPPDHQPYQHKKNKSANGKSVFNSTVRLT